MSTSFSKLLLSVLLIAALSGPSLAIALCWAKVSAQGDNPLPALTGLYQVGVVWRHWVR